MLVDQSKAVVHTCTAMCVPSEKGKPSDVVLSAKRLLEKRHVPRPESIVESSLYDCCVHAYERTREVLVDTPVRLHPHRDIVLFLQQSLLFFLLSFHSLYVTRLYVLSQAQLLLRRANGNKYCMVSPLTFRTFIYLLSVCLSLSLSLSVCVCECGFSPLALSALTGWHQ